MMRLGKRTVIGVATLMIVGFAILSYVMGNRLGDVANDAAVGMAQIIGRVNARIAKAETERPVKLLNQLCSIVESDTVKTLPVAALRENAFYKQTIRWILGQRVDCAIQGESNPLPHYPFNACFRYAG